MKPEDLDLVDTQDLIDALKRRMDTLFVAGLKVPETGRTESMHDLKGDPFTILGLINHEHDKMKVVMMKMWEGMQDEEELDDDAEPE